MKLSICSSLLLAVAGSTASAAIFLEEPFAYADGALTTVSGGTWSVLSGSGNPLTVTSGQVTGLSHGAGSREDNTRVFSGTDVATGDVYAAFTLQVTTAPTANMDYFLGLHGNTNSNFRGRVFLSSPSVSGFRLGLENDSGTTTVLTSDLTAGTPYSVLLRVNAATNLSDLWVGTNAASFSASSPTISDTVAPSSVAALGRIVLRQGSAITAANAVNIDNLRVTDTFAEAIPEPTTGLLVLSGVASVLGLRRRP